MIQTFEENFFKSQISFTNFQNCKFSGKGIELKECFNKKIEIGRGLGLATQHIIKGLSDSLPSDVNC